MNLLDRVLPTYEFGNRHAIVIDAPPDVVSAAFSGFRLETDGPWGVRALFRLRGLRPLTGTLRHALASRGFTVIAERPGEQVVFGVAGRFWAVRELRALSAVPSLEAFDAFRVPGTAKAALSLRYEPLDGGGTRLTTETRVHCIDQTAYRWFRAYWMLIEPFSGWIRRALLHAIARKVAASAAGAERPYGSRRADEG
jgi:hypothetical protein